jgi:hypothetical protein
MSSEKIVDITFDSIDDNFVQIQKSINTAIEAINKINEASDDDLLHFAIGNLNVSIENLTNMREILQNLKEIYKSTKENEENEENIETYDEEIEENEQIL